MISKFKLDPSKNTETKEAINRTLAIANNYAGELSIEILPLDKIELDPENARDLVLTLHDAIHGIEPTDPLQEKKKHDWKSLESLAKTIRDDQLINPIYVYRYGNKCRLIAGERRTLASAIAGKKEIIARIASERPIGTKLKVLQWIENNERVDLSLAERIASLEDIIKEYYVTNKENSMRGPITAKLLGDLTGMSLTQSRRYILILHAKPEIKQAITDGKLDNIKLIELICSVEHVAYQKELLEAAISGRSFEAIMQLKKELELNEKKPKKNRISKKSKISLGAIKLNVIKVIVDAVAASSLVNENIIKQMKIINSDIQWDNSGSVSRSFKKIITLLEQGA